MPTTLPRYELKVYMVDRILSFSVKYPLDMVSYLFLLVPFTMGLVRYAHLQKEEKTFLYYFAFVFLKETGALAIMLAGHTNMYLQNVQSLIDILFFGVAYAYVLHGLKCRTTLVVSATLSLASALLFFDASDISPVNQIAARLFAIVVVLLFFNDLLSQLRVMRLFQYPMFWISAGLLLYATGTFLIALFSRLLVSGMMTNPDATYDFFWDMQQGLFILFCLFASAGFWVSRYESQQAVL